MSIRESRDHNLCAGSPKLFADFHALHRLLMPRHPPCALSNLIDGISNSSAPTSTPAWFPNRSSLHQQARFQSRPPSHCFSAVAGSICFRFTIQPIALAIAGTRHSSRSFEERRTPIPFGIESHHSQTIIDRHFQSRFLSVSSTCRKMPSTIPTKLSKIGFRHFERGLLLSEAVFVAGQVFCRLCRFRSRPFRNFFSRWSVGLRRCVSERCKIIQISGAFASPPRFFSSVFSRMLFSSKKTLGNHRWRSLLRRVSRSACWWSD